MVATSIGGLTQGIQTGFNMTQDAYRDSDNRKENDRRAKQQDRTQARNELIQKINASTSLFNNKNVPDSVKLEQFNSAYVPAMEELTGSKVPMISSWGADIGKLTQKIRGIIGDATLSSEEKQTSLFAIMAESKNNPELSPYIEHGIKDIESQLKAQKEEQLLADVNFMKSQAGANKRLGPNSVGPAQLSQEEIMNFARINKNPEYATQVGNMVFNEQASPSVPEIGSKEHVLSTPSTNDDMAYYLNSDDPKLQALGKSMMEGKRMSVQEYNDREAFKVANKQLPVLEAEALAAKSSLPQLREALDLVETGYVTGAAGAFRAKFAGMLEAMGASDEKIEQYSDAQYYRLLGKLFTGPLRLEILGPGAVTDFEQRMKEQMGGGGATAQSAAKRLLQWYEAKAQAKINNYNAAAMEIGEVNATAGKLNRPIETKSKEERKDSQAIYEDIMSELGVK